MLIYIILGIIVLSVVIIVLIQSNKKPLTPPTLEELFNTTSSTGPDQLGGVLISMISLSDAEKMVAKKSVEYADFDQCAVAHRHTCAAWSYFRRDVWCSAFIMPSMNMYVGFIVEPRKMWPLLTTMAVIDADTNLRSACSNEAEYDVLLATKPHKNCASYEGASVYLPKQYSGLNPTQCAPNDEACQFLNSGGGINVWDMVNNWDCKNCVSKEKLVFDRFNANLDECTLCKKPYLCIPKKTASKNPVEEATQLSAYVGADSEHWRSMFVSEGYPNIGRIAISQCKYSKYNWKEWILALHSFYQYLLESLSPDNSSRYPVFMFQQDPIYLENEVNSYIYPDKTSVEYKTQDKIFKSSIRGVFYITSTCTDQLAPIAKFTPIEKVCNSLYGVDSSAVREKIEQANLTWAKELATEIGQILNVPVYQARPDSNAFPSYNSLTKALAAQLEWKDIFVVN